MEENEKDKKNALRYHTANILQLNRSIGQYNDDFFGQESQVVLQKLSNYANKIITTQLEIKPDEYLKTIQHIMHVDEENSKTVRHFIGQIENNLRISNHSANAVHAQFRPNETSVVIKLSSTKFNSDKNSYLVEYVYNSKNLTKEKQIGIIKGLKDWINTGTFTDTNFDKDFYSPNKEECLIHIDNLKSSTQNMIKNDGLIYGFINEGKIYLSPEIWNSEVAVHEYTHLWDKGKEILKAFNLF